MKKLILITLTVWCVLFFLIIPLVSAEKIKDPQAFVINHVYSFKPAIEGKTIVHDYMIQNKGGSVLNIEKVETG